MASFRLTYGLATTKGLERKVNLDSAIALTWTNVPRFNGQEVGLFIVADGIGAPESGLRASQTAIQIISQEIEISIFQPTDLSISQIMTAAVQKANRQVIAESDRDGTTLTAALLIGSQAYIAHVGDSRAHYVYSEYLIQLTYVHTLLERMIDLRQFTWEQVKTGEIHYENMILRCLGMSENLDIDIVTKNLVQGSYLLLSTDGLSGWHWSYIEEASVLSVIHDNPPQLACDKLIDLAQKGGSGDDITAIVIKFSEQ